MDIVVVEHQPDAPAGLLGDWAAERGHGAKIVRVHAGDPWPDAGGVQRAVVLGTPVPLAPDTMLDQIEARVEINGREFIDGGIRSTTNVDVAVEHGAKFIVVINPLVPYANDFRKRIPTVTGTRARRVSDMGFTAVGNQAFRLLSHERLHVAVQQWEQRYPGVDIILIEPELDDELMFGTSILDYSARLEIAKHGFESVTLRLARDYERYKSIAERHGIQISARRVRHVLDQVEREREKQSAWRRVLEQTTAALLRAPHAGAARAVLAADRYAGIEVHRWRFGGRPA